MFLKIVLSLFIFCSAFSLTVCLLEVDSCTKGEPLPSYVEVVGCDAQPCIFKKGSQVEMFMNFTATDLIEQLKVEVLATVAGVPINYPLPQSNACASLTNTHCPLEKNEPGQYKLEMPIDKSYPPISLRLTLYLLPNGLRDRLVCFTIAARVQN